MLKLKILYHNKRITVHLTLMATVIFLTDYKHPGPAKYEYYMLSGGDGHVMMYQIQLEKLSEHLVTREFFNPAPDRSVSA